MFEEIYQKISQAARIIIHRHQNPDPDALGSQYGLQALINQVFPNKTVKCAGSIPETLHFLAQPEPIFECDYEDALVLILDTANQERIDGNLEWMKKGNLWIKIDHHPNNDHYANLEYVDEKASSTAEIIFDFYQAMQAKMTMNAKAARYLYAGLIGDTGRFLHPNTTARTFEVASELRKYPFDYVQLNLDFIERSKEQTYLAGYVQSNFILNDKGVAYIILSNETLAKFNVSHEEAALSVGLLANIKGVKSWALFMEKKDQPGIYRCRLRSKKIPIEPIAAKHDGGGHPLASGANAYSTEEIQNIVQELTENIIENENK